MKFLLFVGLLAVVWWLWRKRSVRSGPDGPPVSPKPERMVCCRYCGLYLPESDSVAEGEDRFCSHDHRLAAQYPDKK